MSEMNNGPWIAITGTVIAASAILLYFTLKKCGGLECLFKRRKVTLANQETKYSLPLMRKEVVSPNTAKFRFKLPSPEHILGLPIGQHIHLIAKVNGKTLIRPYTPISSDDDKGYVELMVKIYRANEHPKFPAGGKMTQYIDTLNLGDSIDFRGPSGLLVYKGHGTFKIRPKKNASPVTSNYRKVGMIAGGSGITPMLQIIRAIIKDETDATTVWLLFANQSEDDILLRDELDQLAESHPERFHVWYTVDRPPADWKYSSGFINAEMIEKHLPGPSDDTIILMCGPPSMVNFACTPSLDKLNYPTDIRFVF